VLPHLPLVRRMAQRFWRTGLDVEVGELVSAGTIGLMEARGRYDKTRGIPFTTFVHQRIRGAILDEIRRQRPRWISRSRGMWEQSLDATVATPEGDVRLSDMTADPSSPSPAAHVELNELLDAVGALPRREREMIGLHVKGYTVTEIAELHRCSETRASQLLARARMRLEEATAT
jgi:RNA polymerase sigma factor (sigma-70 family)